MLCPKNIISFKTFRCILLQSFFSFFQDEPFLLYLNGRPLDAGAAVLPRDATIQVLPCNALPGGKGGFGSMLRSLGAGISKTSNRDACRDLSGRRLRDIKEEKELKEYVAKKAEREKEQAEAREAKLQRLRRVANGENKHEFHDAKYDAEREAATERVHDAMEHAFKNKDKASSSSSGVSSEDDEEPKPGCSGVKRKAAEPEKAAEPQQL